MKEYLAPERERVALITIDAQRDFVLPNSPATVGGALSTIPAMRRLIDAFRTAGAPIVHTLRLYRCNGSNVDLCHRAAIEAGARRQSRRGDRVGCRGQEGRVGDQGRSSGLERHAREDRKSVV